MVVAQVYGWLIDDHGRVLVQGTPEGFNLPGGSPELCDEDAVATLAREALEESQVLVDDAVLLGYEEVLRNGDAVALVRMAGRIRRFEARHPDPDGGRLLERRMTSLDTAARLLSWGDSGVAQAAAAGEVAARRWDLPVEVPTAADLYLT